MADDDVDEELLADEEPELDETDLDDLPDDEMDVDDDVEVDVEEEDEDADDPDVGTSSSVSTDDEEDEDEDEEADEDDVEASLDVILKEKLVVADEDDDEEATDQEDRVESSSKVLPKQPDEFVCQSCFLVKHPSQLADRDRLLCRDCV